MHWWLIPAAASMPLLAIACSDSAAETTKTPPAEAPETSQPAKQPSERRDLVLTYFNIPG